MRTPEVGRGPQEWVRTPGGGRGPQDWVRTLGLGEDSRNHGPVGDFPEYWRDLPHPFFGWSHPHPACSTEG